jgi:hypothetical protein
LRHFGSNAFRAETNSSDFNGVDGGCVSFADFGGAGVSDTKAEFLTREVDSKERTGQI